MSTRDGPRLYHCPAKPKNKRTATTMGNQGLFNLSGKCRDRHRRQWRHRARRWHTAAMARVALPSRSSAATQRNRPPRSPNWPTCGAARSPVSRRRHRRRQSCRRAWSARVVGDLGTPRHPRQQCRHQHPQAAARRSTPREWKQRDRRPTCTSAFVCSQAAYPRMKAAGGGKIINIGSMMSIFGALRSRRLCVRARAASCS